MTGQRPVGWMTGRPSPNTRRLLVEEGGFQYDRDALNDELPYWVTVGIDARPHLVIPYSYETNDNRFNENAGFATSDDFVRYMSDTFDVLYAEGGDEPKMMSVGLHDRLIGRPGLCCRIDAISRSRTAARSGVDLHRPRNRGTLDENASLRIRQEISLRLRVHRLMARSSAVPRNHPFQASLAEPFARTPQAFRASDGDCMARNLLSSCASCCNAKDGTGVLIDLV
jgi:hypothetical protein